LVGQAVEKRLGKLNRIKILVLILNLLIIVGAGHGGAPLILFEVFSLKDLGEFKINISGSYEDRIATAALVSLVGQIILISSYFCKKKLKSYLTIAGCFVLLTASFILTKDALDFTIDTLSLFTALPFIATASVLTVKEVRALGKM
jgi:hypothetical protein